jgi:multiple sugar transport system substrate-binding protein
MQRESGKPDSLRDRRAPGNLVFALIVCSLAMFQAGCTTQPSTAKTATKPSLGVVLRIACPGELSAAVVRRYGRDWATESGAEIKIVPYDPDAPSPPELSGDIWIVSPARMPRFAAAGRLLEVPDRYTSPSSPYGWEGLLRDYRNKLLIWDQKVYALPVLGDSSLCFYRTDLLTDSANQSEFKTKFGRQLEPPKTWEDFAMVAEFFHNRKRPGIDRPCPSLPPLGSSDEELDREFFAIAAPLARRARKENDPKHALSSELFSFHYDLESGAIRIDSPGFFNAVAMLNRLQRWRSPGATTQPPAKFMDGEAVLCLAAPSWIERFQQGPSVRGKFGFRNLPGTRVTFDYSTGKAAEINGENDVPYLGVGGFVGVVPVTCAAPEAAFDLLAFLSDARTSSDIVIEPAWGGGVYRREHLDSRVAWHAFGLDPTRTGHLLDCIRQDAVHSQISNPVFRLRIPDEQEHQKALLDEIRASLLRGKAPREALVDAARRWKEIDARVDPKTRRTNYRLSVGLTRND